MKVDKEFLLKHRFWLTLGGAGFFAVVALFVFLIISPRKTAAAQKAVVTDWDKFKLPKVGQIMNNLFVEHAKEEADKAKVKETEVWGEAYHSQKDLSTFPGAFEKRFEFANGRHALEIVIHPKTAKLADLPADEPDPRAAKPVADPAPPKAGEDEGAKQPLEAKGEKDGKGEKDAKQDKDEKDAKQDKDEKDVKRDKDAKGEKDAKAAGEVAADPPATGRFSGELVRFDPEFIEVRGRDSKVPKRVHRTPPEVLKVSLAEDKEKSLQFGALADHVGALVTVSYQRGRYFDDKLTDTQQREFAQKDYRTQLLDIVKLAQPRNELGDVCVQFKDWTGASSDWLRDEAKKAPPPKVFRYVQKWKTDNLDISDEVWIAQEDLWIYRELFRLVKKANDYVADFHPVKGTKGQFENPYWHLELKPVASKDVDAVREIDIVLTNRLDRPQRLDVRFLFQTEPKGPFYLLPRLDGPPLLAAGTVAEERVKDKSGKETDRTEKVRKDRFERRLTLDQPVAGTEVHAVRQVLTWETAAVKRIDQVAMGTAAGDEWAHSHRTSHKALRALKLKLAPKQEDENAGPQKDQPGGKGSGLKQPGGLGKDGPGKGPEAAEDRTPNGLVRDRYLDVTPQARRVPVGIVLIVDQAHVGRVQTAFADSPLRFLMTQVMLHRYPRSVRPTNAAPPGAEFAGGFQAPPGMKAEGPPRPKGVGFGSKGGPPGPPRPSGSGGIEKKYGLPSGPGSKYGPPPYTKAGGSGVPGQYGFPSGDAPSLDVGDEPESNMELVIYGIVSLYERFPPRPPAPETPAPPPPPPGQ